MRKFTGPRGGHNGLRNISASRYLLFLMCQRRWAFRMLERLAEAQGDAAARGEGFHTEQEDWTSHGKFPTSKVGCVAVKYAPAPGYSVAEVPIWLATPKSQWLGFIDLCYDIELLKEPEWRTELVYGKKLKYLVWTPDEPLAGDRKLDNIQGPLQANGRFWGPGFRAAELASTGITVVHDWKFTGAIKNTKSAAELLVDPAFILYAAEAFMGGARRVFGRWVYVQMTGTPTAREIWFEVTLDHVLDQLEAMDEVAGEMQHLYQIRAKGKDLPMPANAGSPDNCFAYGKPCDYYEICQPATIIQMSNIPTGANNMTDAFRSAMTSSFPGLPPLPGAPVVPPLPTSAPALPVTVPPLPGVPALPSLPKAPSVPPLPPTFTAAENAAASALAAAVAPHLAGFINAPASVESGSINPGEAPSVPAASPEEAKVLQQIKPPTPPVQDELDGLTDEQIKELGIAIGAFDKSYKGRRPGRMGLIRVKRLEQGPRTELQQAADEDQAIAHAQPIPSIPPLPLAQIAENSAQKSAGESTIVEPGIGMLCINCAPVNDTGAHSLSEILDMLAPAFKAATGADDYRLVDFGKGAGMMAVGLRDHFAAHGVVALTVDTHTQEGMAFITTLQSLARVVVRGF